MTDKERALDVVRQAVADHGILGAARHLGIAYSAVWKTLNRGNPTQRTVQRILGVQVPEPAPWACNRVRRCSVCRCEIAHGEYCVQCYASELGVSLLPSTPRWVTDLAMQGVRYED